MFGSELEKRVATGVALGLVVVTLCSVALVYPGFRWVILVAAFGVVSLALFEYIRFSAPAGRIHGVFSLLVTVPLIAAGVYSAGFALSSDITRFLAAVRGGPPGIFFGFVVALWFVFFEFLYRSRSVLEAGGERLGERVVSLYLLGVGGAALCLLTVMPRAPLELLWLLLVVCSNDIAAFFGGRHFQGAKLAPALSPGKTISGALCGLGTGAIVGVLTGSLITDIQSQITAFFLALLVVVTAQAGDLLKSFLKRHHDVKDSSALLPGHGGVFDRIDGILAAAPVVYIFL